MQKKMGGKAQTKLELDLSAKEILLMGNLYLSKEFPHNFMTLEEISNLLLVSKATAINITKGMAKKGLITKASSYVSFYYPVNDLEIRRMILERLGFFKDR